LVHDGLVGVTEGPGGAEVVEAQVEGAGVESWVDRVVEGFFRVLIVVSSLILGMGYFLEWTTGIEDRGSSGTGAALSGGDEADRGPSLAGLAGLDLPASLRVVGAPAPTVRFAFPDPSDGWLAVFAVAGNPLEAWGQFGRALAGDFDLPAPHAACSWIIEGAAPVSLTGDGAPEGVTALRCRARAVDVTATGTAPLRELEVALWSTRGAAHLGLAFHELAVTTGDGVEVPVGPSAGPADLADVPYPRGPVEHPDQVAGPGDPFPTPLHCLDIARLPDRSRLVTLVRAPVVPVSSATTSDPDDVPVTGPATAIGVIETDRGAITVLEDLAARSPGAELVTQLSESGRTIRTTAGTGSDGSHCEIRETDDPSLLLVLHQAG
jgi:hypothetical protein